MSLPESMSHQNGQSPASPNSDEAVTFLQQTAKESFGPPHGIQAHEQNRIVTQPKTQVKPVSTRTVFPTDNPTPSLRTFFYNITHQYLAGASLFRWLVIIATALLIYALISWPSQWIAFLVGYACSVIGFYFWRSRLQKSDFVRFEAEPNSARLEFTETPKRLVTTEKIPIHATGLFTVDDKDARFTWLPGFYRTFATREHALLCQVQDQRYLWLAKPDEETLGMWYIFFRPEEIVDMRLGKLYFGSNPAAAIAVTHQVEQEAKGKWGRDKMIQETLYMAFADESDRQQVWSDLQADR